MKSLRFYRVKRAALVIAALSAFFLFCGRELHASTALHISLKPGYDGKFRKDRGLPLKVILENREGNVMAGNMYVTGGLAAYRIPVRIEPYSRNEKWIFVYPVAGSGMNVHFSSAGGITHQSEVHTVPLMSRMGVAVYIARERGKLRSFGSLLYKQNLFFEVTPRDLWNIWKGYEQADFVLLDAGAVELMTPYQLKALKQYVLSGGSLYITGLPYPDVYQQDFFQDMLPVQLNGLRELSPGYLYPGSPAERVLSLQAGDSKAVLRTDKGFVLVAEGEKGLGSVSLLSFDPANRNFYPLMVSRDNFWKREGKEDKMNFIPVPSWSEETRAMFLSIVKWNTGYLFLLIAAGFTVTKRSRRILWSFTCILFVISALASLGIMNGKNRIKGMNVINMSYGEDAFLQSRLSIISAGKGHASTELRNGFVKPLTDEGPSSAYEITLFENGIRNISAYLNMMHYKSVLWERFEVPGEILEVNLEMQADRVSGQIKNVSAYSLINPYILIRGRFYSLPTIKSGHQIQVEIRSREDGSSLYPEGLRWIRSYLQTNEAQGIKVIGSWEKPVLKLNKNSILLQEEKTVLVYHL